MPISFAVIVAFVFLLLGLPIAIVLGLLGMGLVSYEIPSRIFVVSAQVMVDGLNSFVLIAAPFFMLAGEIMNRGGLTRRMFRFANALVGWLPGGLGQVNVMASMLFAGMTGAAISDAVGLGSMEIKAMKDRGYDPKMSAGITAASAIIGPIIPPSVPMVIYGALAGASIGNLFLAGLIPGLLMGGALMVHLYFYARWGHLPIEQRATRSMLRQAALEAIPSLLTPIIVVAGIYSGLFTPTEAAVVAAAYGLLLTIIYGEMNLKELAQIALRVISASGALFFIVAATSLLGWIIARSGVMINIALWLSSTITSQTNLLLIITALYLIVGLFMEPVAALILLVPILLPAVKILQIDLVHFGVITVLALCLGLLTPPVGLVLYAIARIADLQVDEMIKGVLPFLIPLFLVLLAIVVFPDLTLFLPRLLYRLR